MKKRHVLFCLMASFCINILAQEYSIPADSIRIRDPFVTVDHETGKYYIITTARSNGHMALKALESPDLKMWRNCGIVYEGNSGYMQYVQPGTDNWWAPDTYFYKGHYYTIATLSSKQKGRLRCCTILDGGKKPTGPYQDILTKEENLSLTPRGQQCLDGSLYIDDKGQPWLVYSLEWNGPDVKDQVGETWAVKLKKNLRGSKGKPIKLFAANEAEWARQPDGAAYIVDAPFMYKDEASGSLICLWSSFTDTYAVGQAVSRSGRIEGPWEHVDGTIYQNGGHEMIFRDLQGNLKMSLHHNNNDGHLKIVDVQVKDGRFMPVTLP